MIQLAPEFKLQLISQAGKEPLAEPADCGKKGQRSAAQQQNPRTAAAGHRRQGLEMGWVIIRVADPAPYQQAHSLPAALLNRLQQSPTIGSYRNAGPLTACQLRRLECLQIGTGQWCAPEFATWFPTPDSAAFYVNRLPASARSKSARRGQNTGFSAVFLRRCWLEGSDSTAPQAPRQDAQQTSPMLDRFRIR